MGSKMPASDTGGAKPMGIAGRLVSERERLFGMTNAERAWRKQWLKDQILAPHEPVHVPQYHQEITNPIRRFYQWPLNKLWEKLTPSLGGYRAYTIRFWIGKAAMVTAGLYATFYYFKYNQNDWTRKGGWRVIESRRAVLPGEAKYPLVSDRTQPADYAARGFKQSPI
ncbi:NADH dehydrogenase 1, beta subcomplex, subunit 6 [Sergentomyia squamirostris]